MGCTCQTPTCVVPCLTLWLLIIMSKYQLGHSNSIILVKWKSAREYSSQLDCNHGESPSPPLKSESKGFFMQTERILKISKYWLFFHSYVAFSCNSILTIDCRWIKATCILPNNGNPGKAYFLRLLLFQLGADWMNRRKCSTSLYLDACCSFQFEAVY